MFYFGVDYYPEHWEKERLQVDIDLMIDAGVNVVRLAEFAWSRLEPERGTFCFDWLDDAIEALGQKNIVVVLGTPTASPPPWVMEAYPDAYIQWHDGRTASYGGRREYCPNHSGYRELSRKITTAMAQHYADNPHVIGWQTDNEFGDRCYCDICRAAFQKWLKERFGTLDAVNQRWGTVFWSQEYSQWEQIPTPKQTGYIHNPSLELDYRRFMSASYDNFQVEQINILRNVCSEHFITHNLMGFRYDNLDYFSLSEPLDFVSWDNYPRGFWIQDQVVDVANLALGHDTMWGLKQKNFWVMEAHSGPSGWEIIGSTPRPGEIRLWAYQAIAHGADGMIFFRWRSARHGAEQYWHGILDHDGTPRRRYDEFKQVGQELQRIGERIVDSQPRAEVGMLLSYDSRFAFQIQPNNEQFSYPQHFLDYYRALFDKNIDVNIVSTKDDYSNLRVLIAPALYVVTPELASKLKDYAENGGTVIFTSRSGVKEESNVVINAPLPGLLRNLCGIEISEYDSLRNDETVDILFKQSGLCVESSVWSDVITLKEAEVIAEFGTSYYAGQPAISRNQVGKGQVIYIGSLAGKPVVDAIISWVLNDISFPRVDKMADVEIKIRHQTDKQLIFVLNHSEEIQQVILEHSSKDLLSETLHTETFELEPYGIRILVKS